MKVLTYLFFLPLGLWGFPLYAIECFNLENWIKNAQTGERVAYQFAHDLKVKGSLVVRMKMGMFTPEIESQTGRNPNNNQDAPRLLSLIFDSVGDNSVLGGTIRQRDCKVLEVTSPEKHVMTWDIIRYDNSSLYAHLQEELPRLAEQPNLKIEMVNDLKLVITQHNSLKHEYQVDTTHILQIAEKEPSSVYISHGLAKLLQSSIPASEPEMRQQLKTALTVAMPEGDVIVSTKVLKYLEEKNAREKD